jgi:hypothetical protein
VYEIVQDGPLLGQGVAFALLRHQRNDAALKELARVHVRDALERWVPGATLVILAAEQDGPALTLRVRVRERGTNAEVELQLSQGSRAGAAMPDG